MIVSGRHVPAAGGEGARHRRRDRRRARTCARKRSPTPSSVADKRPLPRVRDKADKLAEAKADPGMFEAMRKSIARKARNQKAPYHCIACVEAAATKPFDEGIEIERRLFAELENSDEAKALRYAFFAEREVAKIPGLPKDMVLPEIKTAAVVGAGTMGGGIAMSFADFGFPGEAARCLAARCWTKGMQRIRNNYAVSVKRGSLTQEEMDERLALIEPVDDLRGDRRLRRRDRGRVRADAREEGGVRQARRGHEAGRAALLQHLGARHRRDRQRDEAAGGRGRHALLRARQRHEDLRGGEWRQDLARDAGGRHEARPRHRQDQRLRRQLRRLRRQPHAASPSTSSRG